ncbi:MAG: hypothetical protein AB8B83_02345 [Bdellovibrionales bacterium]
MSSEWKQLPPQDALSFLDAVRVSDHSIFFEPSLCDVFLHPLDFFDGYDLVRISNMYAPPFAIMDFVSNGDNHYYLDGSDFALQTLCKQKSVRLNEDNVLDYIDLYFSYVYERGNSIVFIRNPQDTNFKGSDGMGNHFKAIQKHTSVRVEWNEEKGAFVINAPLLYQDKTREGIIYVSKTGQIDVISPLEVHFLDEPQEFETIPLKHSKDQEILRQARDLLVKAPSGKRLLDIADDMDVAIHIISSPNYQAFATNKPTIYLLMPDAQLTADMHQALQLAGALRDMEQILGGYPRPSRQEDDAVFFAINYDKNLNLLMEICKIVEEFEAINMAEAVTAMRRIGIEDIYGGYKNEASPDEMLQIYIRMMTKQGFIL